MAHVAESKKKIVEEFSELVNSYPVIGVVDMENLPAAQLQKMRGQLRDKVLIRLSRAILPRLECHRHGYCMTKDKCLLFGSQLG